MIRKIIHIDMDAFYASVEQRDNPALRGVPIAVGQSDGRGVVAAASYEARRYGVRSAMSSSKARRLCPQLQFVDCRFDVYKQVSAQIHEIFREYTDVIEPISLDEAFLDVTVNKPGIALALDIAREIKQKIRERLHLVASAGVSYNKFLAKIASDYRKPDGLCVIHPERAMEFIAKMPVESFWGVGPVTAAKMHALGIYTGEDLRRFTVSELGLHFGKAGMLYYNFARGVDTRPVEAYRQRKSRGVERTFDADIVGADAVAAQFQLLIPELLNRLERARFGGNTLTMKVRYSDFSQLTRSISSLPDNLTADTLRPFVAELMSKADFSMPVRLLGLTVSKPAEKLSAADPRQMKFDFD